MSLTVAPGTFVALLGPNGGGKSTLFRICATLQRASEGSVLVFGADVRTEASAVRRQLGVVFQSPALDQRLTVRENLLHHGRLYGLQGRPLRTGIDEALARVGLTDRRTRRSCSRLSGGLKRRAEIAKVLMTRPSLLLLDEPTTGLDPGVRRDLWRDLAAIRASDGTTIVLTTHLLDEAAAADHVCILDRGRLVVDGAPDDADAHGRRRRHPPARRGPGRPGGAHHRAVSGRRLGGRRRGPRRARPRAHVRRPNWWTRFPGEIRSVHFGRPTLEDVFVHFTGRRFE